MTIQTPKTCLNQSYFIVFQDQKSPDGSDSNHKLLRSTFFPRPVAALERLQFRPHSSLALHPLGQKAVMIPAVNRWVRVGILPGRSKIIVQYVSQSSRSPVFFARKNRRGRRAMVLYAYPDFGHHDNSTHIDDGTIDSRPIDDLDTEPVLPHCHTPPYFHPEHCFLDYLLYPRPSRDHRPRASLDYFVGIES